MRSGRQVSSGEIMVLVAGAALLRGYTPSLRPPPHVHGMRMSIVPLPGKVPAGVAVHASWVTQDGEHGLKGSRGPSIIARRCSENTFDFGLVARDGSTSACHAHRHYAQEECKDDRE